MVYTPVYTDATAIYKKSGLTVTECDVEANDKQLIEEAEAELEDMCSRKFTSGNVATDHFSGKVKDIFDNYMTVVQLTHYPVQSITEAKIVDMDGTSVHTLDTLTTVEVTAGTFDSEDYWLKTCNDPLTNTMIPYGELKLKTLTIPYGTNNFKVAYTYGHTSVPRPVKDLAACLGGIRAWVAFMGGQYNRMDSYTVPQQVANKGDFYARGQRMIDALTVEANGLLDRIGRKTRTMVSFSGGDR